MPLDLKALVRTIPDYPKKGILFRDITTLIEHPEGFKESIEAIAGRYRGQGITHVASIEARGFIFGAGVAIALGVGFIPVRKKGKLPGETIGQNYALEYGVDTIEIHADVLGPDNHVLLVDDLIADAKALQAAGAFCVVLECVPRDLAARVTSSLAIPTIGIGAGNGTDAQVLVWQDMAGLTPRTAKFVKRFADMNTLLGDAARGFAEEVVGGTYPGAEHSYH